MNDMKQSLSQSAWNRKELLVRVDNDQELLCDLLNIFKSDFPQNMATLRGAIAAGDCKTATFISHTLKGMLASLAAGRASAAAAELERQARAANGAALELAFEALEREAAGLVPEIEAYMAEVGA